MINRVRGFTLIEMIIAIAVIAIIMIPISLMLMEYVRAIAYADSLTVAANLAQRELGIINNLGYGVLNNALFTNYAGYNFDLDRVVSYVSGTNNNLKMVRLRVFPHPMASSGQLLDLVTYVIGMNVGFGAGSSGGAAGSEGASLSVSGGALSRNSLSNVTLRNIRSDGNITIGNITMKGVIVSSTRNRTLNSITINGDSRISNSVPITSNPILVPFSRNFFMKYPIIYSGASGGQFNFAGGPNQPYTLTIIFVFYDETQSAPYVWTY